MLEEIKKEIEEQSYNENFCTKIIQLDDLFKILDKYQLMYPDYKNLLYKNDSITTELQNYKSAFEELKYEYISGENKQYENNTVKQIQQKYNLGGD